MLEDQGIRAVLLKGAILSDQLYGDPAIRRSLDIDILVDWQDFRQATNALRKAGLRLFEKPPPENDWRTELWRKLAKDVTLYDPEYDVAVELHHRLKSPDTLLPTLGISDARCTHMLGGVGLRAFSRADLFVYLCAHGSTSFWHRLKWLLDAHAFIEELTLEEIDALQAHSASHGTQRCSALALLLLEDLWGRKLPESVRQMARSDRALADLRTASHVRLLGPERDYTSFSNTLARRNLMQLRSDKAYRRSLRLELVHDRELLETIALPRSLGWLYFPLRIGLFTKRKLGL